MSQFNRLMYTCNFKIIFGAFNGILIYVLNYLFDIF